MYYEFWPEHWKGTRQGVPGPENCNLRVLNATINTTAGGVESEEHGEGSTEN